MSVDIDSARLLDEIFGAASTGSDMVIPRPEGARGMMLVAFDGETAAAYFSDDDGPSITRNPTPLSNPPFIPVDGHVPYYFPPYAVLPLPAVRDAVTEYLQTGQRPRCVEWLQVNWYTTAG
jgi:hypothetical protein